MAAKPTILQHKMSKVMKEWKTGALKSHGKPVTDQKQAIAIAYSEAAKRGSRQP
jgi:hypothetical protein